ncbi:MAG: hypothetical protein AAF533_18310 [Acidobacteriota bacterium]
MRTETSTVPLFASASFAGGGEIVVGGGRVLRLVEGAWVDEGPLGADAGIRHVAFSTDGERVAACADDGDTSWVGIHEQEAGAWQEVARLEAPSGCSAGQALSLDGDLVAFGSGTQVVVHASDAEGWAHQATLESPAPVGSVEWGSFGSHVSLSGRRLALLTRSTPSWVVRIHVLEDGEWVQEAELPSPRPSYPDARQAFELDGGLLAVGDSHANLRGGSAGVVSVFRLDEDGWSLDEQVFGESTSPGDRFGISLSLSHGVLSVGACEDQSPTGRGTAMVFRRLADGWEEVALVYPEEPQAGYYGMATTLLADGSVIVAGQVGPDVHEYRFQGLTPEVSAPGSSVPLRLALAGGALRFDFEDLGEQLVEAHVLHAGTLGDWTGTETIACGSGGLVAGESGRRRFTVALPPGDRFFLVGADGHHGPGRLGADWAGVARCP